MMQCRWPGRSTEARTASSPLDSAPETRGGRGLAEYLLELGQEVGTIRELALQS